MTWQQVHIGFLRNLVGSALAQERRRLLQRISEVENQASWSRRCVWASVLVAGLFFVIADLAQRGRLGVSGPAAEVCVKLGIGGGILVAVVGSMFLGFWLWQRGQLRQWMRDAERFALGLLRDRAEGVHTANVLVAGPDHVSLTVRPAAEVGLFSRQERDRQRPLRKHANPRIRAEAP